MHLRDGRNARRNANNRKHPQPKVWAKSSRATITSSSYKEGRHRACRYVYRAVVNWIGQPETPGKEWSPSGKPNDHKSARHFRPKRTIYPLLFYPFLERYSHMCFQINNLLLPQKNRPQHSGFTRSRPTLYVFRLRNT